MKSLPYPQKNNRSAIEKNTGKVAAYFLLCFSVLVLSGCSTTVTTNPPRSVTEQLLISTAADKAIATTNLCWISGKKVYVDGTYFDSYDSKYVLGTIRDAFSSAGGFLVNDEASSDITVEARSGGLSIDASDSLFGVPALGIPIPLAGVVNILELAIFKADEQHSIAKLALLAYETKSREHVYSSGPMKGKSYNKYYKFLGLIQWTTTDIPEKK